MKRLLSFTAILVIVFSACNPESIKISTGDEAKSDTMQYGEMKQYWLTLLYKGPNRTQDSTAAERIQAAHLANIDRLAKEGKIVMAGPMGYDKDLRGIFIIDAKDSAEAASYINTDSAIITGRLRFELHPWWTAKGKYEFK